MELNNLEQITLTGRIHEIRARARQRKTYLDLLKQYTGLDTTDLCLLPDTETEFCERVIAL